ncbi:c-type cytochrome [Thermopirellula anaerolimosa]
MKKNKHLLLWSSLGVSCLLLAAAAQENVLREWRGIQRDVARRDDLEIRIRQVVAPRTSRVDRCVTCHVGMDSGERLSASQPMAKPHPPVVHDPADFGCTVCHGGQGGATDKADAHGHVPFWPTPMIPLSYAYAGCGSCHTQVGIPDEAGLTLGRNLIERYDCLACHRIDGRGGTLRPGGVGGMEGPDLSRIGRKGFSPQWYPTHLERSRADRQDVWHHAVPELPPNDLRIIEAYLAGRVGSPRLVEGQALFQSLGCRGCHKIGTVGGTDGPDLTQIGLRDPARLDFTHVPGEHTLANWLSEHTRDPARVVPGSKMPRFQLSDDQIDLLTYYLLSLRREGASEGYQPKDRLLVERFGQREFAPDGAVLFATFCSGCHGSSGEGKRFPGNPPYPAVGNPDFLATADDAFLVQTIRNGRPGRRMPAFSESEVGLTDEEIDAIVKHLRSRTGISPPQPVHSNPRWVVADVGRGKALYEARCAGCHGPDGSGTDAPSLRHPNLLKFASDDYLVETIRRGRSGTAMPGFTRPSPAFPVLAPEEIEAITAYLRTWETAP